MSMRCLLRIRIMKRKIDSFSFRCHFCIEKTFNVNLFHGNTIAHVCVGIGCQTESKLFPGYYIFGPRIRFVCAYCCDCLPNVFPRRTSVLNMRITALFSANDKFII